MVMRRTILGAVLVPFVSAFLGGLVAVSLLVPTRVAAQPSHLDEVRAAAFSLVDDDGTVLARLAPGPNGGGNFSLRDAMGTQRLVLGGRGVVIVYDQDGTTPALEAGRTFET